MYQRNFRGEEAKIERHISSKIEPCDIVEEAI